MPELGIVQAIGALGGIGGIFGFLILRAWLSFVESAQEEYRQTRQQYLDNYIKLLAQQREVDDRTIAAIEAQKLAMVEFRNELRILNQGIAQIIQIVGRPSTRAISPDRHAGQERD